MRPHRRQPTRLPHPWDSPGKNNGVGCHFLLPCMKVKSESEVAQSCLTLSDPMDCRLPGSRVHGICQARLLEWGAIAFSYGRVNSEQTRSRHRAHRGGGGGGQLPSGPPLHPLGSGSGRLRGAASAAGGEQGAAAKPGCSSTFALA